MAMAVQKHSLPPGPAGWSWVDSPVPAAVFFSPELGEHALDATGIEHQTQCTRTREKDFFRLDSLFRGSLLLRDGKAALSCDSPFFL